MGACIVVQEKDSGCSSCWTLFGHLFNHFGQHNVGVVLASDCHLLWQYVYADRTTEIEENCEHSLSGTKVRPKNVGTRFIFRNPDTIIALSWSCVVIKPTLITCHDV